MTESEVLQLNTDFSNLFDVLYNNITSNLAAGLDEYEKSVFFTRALDEIVKGYFNPVLNKTQEGYDASERRQVDFSMITRSRIYNNVTYTIQAATGGTTKEEAIPWEESPVRLTTQGEKDFGILKNAGNTLELTPLEGGRFEEEYDDIAGIIADIERAFKEAQFVIVRAVYAGGKDDSIEVSSFKNPIFDLRDNTRSVIVDEDIMMMINEFVVVERDRKEKRLTVLPINYDEYSRIMTRPYQRPTKNQAWRLIDNVNDRRTAELIVGPYDKLKQYAIRYVQRPEPIILADLEGDLSIGTYTKANCCKLDPILHPEIIQRAVELAYAAYRGSLGDQLTIANQSQTPLGVVSSGGGGNRQQQQ